MVHRAHTRWRRRPAALDVSTVDSSAGRAPAAAGIGEGQACGPRIGPARPRGPDAGSRAVRPAHNATKAAISALLSRRRYPATPRVPRRAICPAVVAPHCLNIDGSLPANGNPPAAPSGSRPKEMESPGQWKLPGRAIWLPANGNGASRESRPMETPRPRGVSNGYETPRGRDVCPAAAFVCRPSSTGRPGTTLCRLGTAATAGRAQGCRRPPAPRPAAAAARSAARGPWCAARRVEATRRGCRQREASPRPLAGRLAGAEVGAGGRAPGWRRAVRRQGPRAVGAGGGLGGWGCRGSRSACLWT